MLRIFSVHYVSVHLHRYGCRLYVMAFRKWTRGTKGPVEEKSRNKEEEIKIEEVVRISSPYAEPAGRGTGVRRLKQHLYARLLTLTSSRSCDIIYFFGNIYTDIVRALFNALFVCVCVWKRSTGPCNVDWLCRFKRVDAIGTGLK